MRTRTAAAAAVLLGGLVLSACSSTGTPTPVSDSTSGSGTTTTSPAVATSATPAPSSAPASSAAPVTSPSASAATTTACAPSGTGVPAGAVTKQIIDVDGDGRPETGWLSGGVNFGITTASGATFSVPINLAGGGARSVLVADTDGKGTIAALASDGRTVDLFLVRNCGLFPAKNLQNQPYQFDLGFRGTGTGIGCSQVAGTDGRSLVGLNVKLGPNAQPESVQRTQILITGTEARNGATDSVAGTPSAVATGSQITCGNLTMAQDGVIEHR